MRIVLHIRTLIRLCYKLVNIYKKNVLVTQEKQNVQVIYSKNNFKNMI